MLFRSADIAAGVYAAQACTAALLGKARSGRGRHVELNLFEVCCALQSTVLAEDTLRGGLPAEGVSAPNGVFATMLVISVIVLGAEWLIGKLEHRLLSWRPPAPTEAANTI